MYRIRVIRSQGTLPSQRVVPSRKWLEFEGGVISGLFNQPGPALERRGRSRHDDG